MIILYAMTLNRHRLISSLRRRYLWLTVFAVLLASAPLRIYNLHTHPPGLYGDEAADGIDAIRILQGARPIYLTENNGREPLHAYLVAFAISSMGRTPSAVRLPSAIVSIATVLGVYLTATSLFGRRVGLLAALIGGFTIWPIMLGRLATRPALLPFLLAYGLWFGIRAWQTRRLTHWAVSGLLFGVAFYSYTSIRLVILALPLWAAVVISSSKARRLWPGALLFLAILATVVFPLASYSAAHWEDVFGRASGLSVLSINDTPRQTVATLANQLGIVVPMFVVPNAGDWNLRHNIPSRPIFDPVMAVAFITGIFISCQSKHRTKALFCFIWVVVSLIPTTLSEEPPHFARSSGAISLIFIWPALGLDWLYRVISRYRSHLVAIMVPAACLAISIFVTVRDLYLDAYLTLPATAFWFDSQCTDAAIDINKYIRSGWVGESWVEPQNRLHEHRQVLMAANVCPQYSSSGYYSVQFLVPPGPSEAPTITRYTMVNLPDIHDLAPEVLFIALPGDEETLVPWLSARYTTTVIDGSWTPPDLLGNSWLVYRTISAVQR